MLAPAGVSHEGVERSSVSVIFVLLLTLQYGTLFSAFGLILQ